MLRKTLYTFYVTINIRKIKTIFQKTQKKFTFPKSAINTYRAKRERE